MDNREKLAAAMLPFLYPQWPARWGWTEASSEMKKRCFEMADELIQKRAIPSTN